MITAEPNQIPTRIQVDLSTLSEWKETTKMERKQSQRSLITQDTKEKWENRLYMYTQTIKDFSDLQIGNCDVTFSSLVNVCKCFRDVCCLHQQDALP